MRLFRYLVSHSQHQCLRSRHTYSPRRALVYVPGNDERKIQKIPSLNADIVVLDCEDGVSINKKDEARQKIRRILEDRPDWGRTELSVRLNSVSSDLCKEDMKSVLTAKFLPPTILLPKVDTKAELTWFAETISSILKDRSDKHQISLISYVESAQSLLNLQALCEHALDLGGKDGLFKLEALVFGSDDFCADIGATRTPDAKELMYARQRIVAVAKAFRLQAIDLVHIDYKDLSGLRTQSIEGAQMGFTGKQVIHPGQIPVVQEAFSPSVDKIKWARDMINEFQKHEASGKGAFSFRGHMIDMPSVLQARSILKLADLMSNDKC